MAGFITRNEVSANEQYIRDTYGDEFFQACMEAEEGTTFLGLLVQHGKL